MTALEGNGVDLPDIAFVAKRIDVTILDLAMLTGAVDGLRLRLKQMQQEKQELFESLETYYKVFFLGEDLEYDNGD